MTDKIYKIKSIEDFLQVPADRLVACLEEFKVWCEITTPLIEGTRAMASAIGVNESDLKFSHGFTWIDDGERNVTINFDVDEGK